MVMTLPGFPYVWNWRVTYPEKLGLPCHVALAHDGTGRIDVTFPDGTKTRVVRWAVRKPK